MFKYRRSGHFQRRSCAAAAPQTVVVAQLTIQTDISRVTGRNDATPLADAKRRQKAGRILKNYGRRTEVKLCKKAIDDHQSAAWKEMHQEQCRREGEALKRKQDLLAKKKKAALECQQRSNHIKKERMERMKANK